MTHSSGEKTMISGKSRLMLCHELTRLTAIAVLAIALVISTTQLLWSQGEVFPAGMKDVKMGASLSSVTEKIKTEGTHSTEAVPGQPRQKLTWVISNDPSYENVEFQFTEKDRLYMIRFSLKKELWRNSRNLKKDFFDKFGIAPDDPLRLRIKNQDILVYAADKGECEFLDFTEASTGEKSFVLVNKAISIADRTGASTEKKDESKSN
jgi:hypothetical protein